MVAIPAVAWLAIFGYSALQPINAAIVLLGPFSLFIAAMNLMPTGNLDGKVAWGLLPELIHRSRLQQRETTRYKSPR
jgi:membrane-associated protease RseP (regulator of RpoE activity)